jgi:phospholipid/cholesterol/gamma-HCH transport system substrate-binding protein
MNRWYRITAAVVVAVLLVAGGLWYFRDKPTLTVSADFAQSDGIFPGNEVEILGVPVGTVTAIEPRGGTVRITMSLPADTRLPSDVHAWVITPSVISEKYVELDPPYRNGNLAGDGLVIPVERTHSPLAFDELVRSLDMLVIAFGPDGLNQNGSLGQVLHQGADALDGNGAKVRDAVHSIAQASGLLSGKTGDISTLLDTLDRLVHVITDNKSTVDSVSTEVTQAAQLFGQQRGAISDTLTQLSGALGQVSDIVARQGKPLNDDLTKLTSLSTTIVAHQQQLAEILDTTPLAFDNFGRAITPDDRLRIRLNISTNLSQIPVARQLCAKFPIPLCDGAGIANPIQFPPDVSSLLGLNSVLGGGHR